MTMQRGKPVRRGIQDITGPLTAGFFFARSPIRINPRAQPAVGRATFEAGRTRHAAPDEPQGQAVKDQITADIVAGSAKAAPAVVGSAVSAAQGLALADVAVMLTILYTGILTATTVIKNWGMWIEWWAARVSDVRRFAAWVRRRG